MHMSVPSCMHMVNKHAYKILKKKGVLYVIARKEWFLLARIGRILCWWLHLPDWYGLLLYLFNRILVRKSMTNLVMNHDSGS